MDFTKALLFGSDVRASLYDHVLFVQADLSCADLRRSIFDACDFTDAVMKDVRLTHDQRRLLDLSESQRREIDWQDEDGEEPEGG